MSAIPTLQFEVKKDALRQTQAGLWKITFTVHPDDMPLDLAKAPMGAHYVCVLAPADYDPTEGSEPDLEAGFPVPPEPIRTHEEVGDGGVFMRRRFRELPRAQQAALKCQDADFQAWLNSLGNCCPNGDVAAVIVRKMCGVESRSALSTDAEAGKRWDALLLEYEQATGRFAVERRSA